MRNNTLNYLKIYDSTFFQDRDAETRKSAEKILGILLATIPAVRSAADVGCGVGTWLSVLSDRGISDLRGFDGAWVDQSLLRISPESFREVNLQQPVIAERRFDLTISLEVAEHLPEAVAEQFVDSLTGLADFVLFSAAIPYQGGVNHVNEQWQSYWAVKFAERGYEALDPFRPAIWSDPKISIPYRQNMILYVKRNRIGECGLRPTHVNALSIVHPELYELRNSKSVMQSLRDLKATTSDKLARAAGYK